MTRLSSLGNRRPGSGWRRVLAVSLLLFTGVSCGPVELPAEGNVRCDYNHQAVCYCDLVLDCTCDSRVSEDRLLGNYTFQSDRYEELTCRATLTSTSGLGP